MLPVFFACLLESGGHRERVAALWALRFGRGGEPGAYPPGAPALPLVGLSRRTTTNP